MSAKGEAELNALQRRVRNAALLLVGLFATGVVGRSEEHTSELQSQ